MVHFGVFLVDVLSSRRLSFSKGHPEGPKVTNLTRLGALRPGEFGLAAFCPCLLAPALALALFRLRLRLRVLPFFDLFLLSQSYFSKPV